VSILTSQLASQSSFIALTSGGQNLWQLEMADRGDRYEISIIATAAVKQLHLLPFHHHCGKQTVVTPFWTLHS
jgi:hypothetical protein